MLDFGNLPCLSRKSLPQPFLVTSIPQVVRCTFGGVSLNSSLKYTIAYTFSALLYSQITILYHSALSKSFKACGARRQTQLNLKWHYCLCKYFTQSSLHTRCLSATKGVCGCQSHFLRRQCTFSRKKLKAWPEFWTNWASKAKFEICSKAA